MSLVPCVQIPLAGVTEAIRLQPTRSRLTSAAWTKQRRPAPQATGT